MKKRKNGGTYSEKNYYQQQIKSMLRKCFSLIVSQNYKMNRINVFVIGIFISLISISCNNSVKINSEFSIEYMEMFSSISLSNENQGFVADVTEAYWNKDSLVVSGNKGCFLIIFGETEYNDEMIQIECNELKKKLKTKPIKKYNRN